MKRVKNYLEFLLIKLAEAVVSAPPLDVALRWGAGLGAVVQKVMGKRDRLIVANLSASFPEKNAGDIRSIADAFWRNIGRVAIEFVRAPEIARQNQDHARFAENIDVARAAFAEQRGVIFVSGHYCNWEFNGILLQQVAKFLGSAFTAIARPMRNPHAEAWVRSRRQAAGTSIILHREAVRASLKTLRRKEAIGILIDQNLYTGGVFANFFGRPAATTTLPALLHNRTGAPVVLTRLRREAGRFYIHFERITLPDVPEDQKMTAWTQHINDRLEAMIREKPEWWFWIHNRWKRSKEAPVS